MFFIIINHERAVKRAAGIFHLLVFQNETHTFFKQLIELRAAVSVNMELFFTNLKIEPVFSKRLWSVFDKKSAITHLVRYAFSAAAY